MLVRGIRANLKHFLMTKYWLLLLDRMLVHFWGVAFPSLSTPASPPSPHPPPPLTVRLLTQLPWLATGWSQSVTFRQNLRNLGFRYLSSKLWDVAFDVQVSEMVGNSYSERHTVTTVEGILLYTTKKKRRKWDEVRFSSHKQLFQPCWASLAWHR